MNNRLVFLSIILFFTFGLSSCWINDFSDVEVEVEGFKPTYGFPIVNSTITILDLLGNDDNSEFIIVDSAANTITLSIIADEATYSLDLNDFKMPDKDFSAFFPVLPLTDEVVYEDYATIDDLVSELKYVEVNDGVLEVSFSKDFTYRFDVELHLHSLLDNTGSPIVVVPNWNQNPRSYTERITLSDHKIDLYDELTPPHYNVFRYEIRFGNVESDGVNIDQLDIGFSFRNLMFTKMVGDINYPMRLEPEDFNVSLFESILGGRMYFADPSFHLDVTSSFGTPVALSIDEMIFFNNSGEQEEARNRGSRTDNTLLLDGEYNYMDPAIDDGSRNESSFVLNAQNSNFPDVLALAPDEGYFSGVFYLGQSNDPLLNRHDAFVYSTSCFDLKTRMEIPLFGWFDALLLKLPMDDFNFPVLNDDSMLDLDFVELKLKTENGLPLDFRLQAIFYDANGFVLDSLFEGNDAGLFVTSPEIQTSGEPTELVVTETSVKLNKDKYILISQADRAEYTIRVDSGRNNGSTVNVNIGPNYTLNIKLSVLLSAEISPGVILSDDD